MYPAILSCSRVLLLRRARVTDARSYERLCDYLMYAERIANEIKYDTDAFSEERRVMMAVTAEIEDALSCVETQLDKKLKEDYHA